MSNYLVNVSSTLSIIESRLRVIARKNLKYDEMLKRGRELFTFQKFPFTIKYYDPVTRDLSIVIIKSRTHWNEWANGIYQKRGIIWRERRMLKLRLNRLRSMKKKTNLYKSGTYRPGHRWDYMDSDEFDSYF